MQNKLLVLFLLLFQTASYSSQTGKFEVELDHLGSKRKVSLFVPTVYDSSKLYDVMVMLHGAQGNPEVLTQTVADNVVHNDVLAHYIYIAPDGGDDPSKNFHVPLDDITIIDRCIEYVKENYSIDTNRIFLEGFSLGGRSALVYGLENSEKFHALILNTPAFQRPRDAMNETDLEELPYIDYSKAGNLQIVVNNGGDDIFYLKSIDIAVDSLYANRAKVFHQVTSKMGHIINLSSFVEANEMFNGGTYGDNDARLIAVEATGNTLKQNPEIAIKFQSRGDIPVKTMKLEVSVNGSVSYINWSGNAKKFIAIDFETQEIELQTGNNNVHIKIVEINETPVSENASEIAFSVFYTNPAKKLPYFCDFSDDEWHKEMSIFESPSLENLGFEEYDGDEYLVRYTNPTLMYFDYKGFRDELYLPFVDLSSADKPTFSFDIAYNYFVYIQNNTTTIYADTLVVSISTDGGESFEEIYRKYESDLLTFDQPFNGVYDQNFIYSVVPTKEDWRTEEIDLSAYKDSKNAQLRIEIIDAWGGLTMLDNFKIDTKTSVHNILNFGKLSIFPNPSTDYLTIDTKEKIELFKIVDMLGNDVTAKVTLEGKTLDLTALASGTYTLVVDGKTAQVAVSR